MIFIKLKKEVMFNQLEIFVDFRRFSTQCLLKLLFKYLPNAGTAVDISGKSPFNCNKKTIKDRNRDTPKEIFSPASLGTMYEIRIRTACMKVGTI